VRDVDRAGGPDRLLPLALSRPADAYAQASQLLAGHPDPYAASVAHHARAIVLREAGQVRDAIRELRSAVRLARVSGSAERVVDVQATLGLSLGVAGRTAAGLAELDAAVAASTGALKGRVLMRRAYVLHHLGRHLDALADLQRAIVALRRAGDTVWEARSRNLRFLVHGALGRAARADRDIVTAAALYAANGQELEYAMSVHSRADVAFQRGDLPAALRYLDDAGTLYAKLDVFRPNLAIDRCLVLLAAGLADEAQATADDAVRRFATGPPVKRAELLFTAARAARSADRPEEAAHRAAAALRLFRAQHRAWWAARASFVLVQSRHQAGERGGRLYVQASRIANRLEELRAEEAPTAHLLAGRIAAERGRAADAERHFARAARFRRRGPTFGRAVGWLAQALRAEAAGRTRAALIACERGLAAAGEHQRSLGATELRAYATAYGTELAAIAQRHAIARRDGRMLLRWTERWRAAVLATPPARPPEDRELAADLAALRAVTRRLDGARSAGPVPAALEHERLRLEAAIRSRTRHAAGSTGGSATDRAGAGDVLDQLDGHRLVELIALDGTLYAVVSAGRRVRFHAIGPVDAAVREVDFARFLLRRLAHGRPPPDALDRLATAARRLEATLLGRVATDLDGGPVVLVPPGLLHAVPWGLLPSLRHAAVRVAPSVAAWLRARAARPPANRRTVLVVGPGLPGTAAETQKIADGYPDRTVLGSGRATADQVLSALDGAWTAHVAAHGVFRADNPLFSALRLDDGPLTVHDLTRLRRAPHRMLLSSCESGVAARVGADALLGMASALAPLGTVSLLASVVPVNDAATAPFMVTFHERLRAGRSFPDALVESRERVGHDPVAVATALSFIALGR
jgi:tetratricopeptide (TPR) repeat protein